MATQPNYPLLSVTIKCSESEPGNLYSTLCVGSGYLPNYATMTIQVNCTYPGAPQATAGNGGGNPNVNILATYPVTNENGDQIGWYCDVQAPSLETMDGGWPCLLSVSCQPNSAAKRDGEK